MNSTTSLVAHQCRIQEWAAQIRDCKNRATGMTVKEWCDQHEVTTANYYYRLTQVRKACLESVPIKPVEQSVVPIPAEMLNNSSALNGDVELCINDICIRVKTDTSPELLKMVLQVATHVK